MMFRWTEINRFVNVSIDVNLCKPSECYPTHNSALIGRYYLALGLDLLSQGYTKNYADMREANLTNTPQTNPISNCWQI